MIVDSITLYNGILGKPWICKIDAITTPTYQKIRYPISGGGVEQINSDQAMESRCSAQRLKESKQTQFIPVSLEDLGEKDLAEEMMKLIPVSLADQKGKETTNPQ